jgi:hypothetical protein
MARERAAAVERVARLAYWRAEDAWVVVEAWRGSGERLSAFARRYGIRRQRLGRWARELGELGELEGREEAVRFHPVRLVRQEAGAGGPGAQPIEIVLVPPGFAAEDLERVLAVLGAGA